MLDTWFSSALWCHSTLGWPEDTRELATFLPSSVLVTGFDIIFFWVARMIMTTTYFTGKVPFRDVYINALVRDEEGQKMSKSKGNVLDPLDLIDGVDARRRSSRSARRTCSIRGRRSRSRSARASSFPNGIPSFGADALRFTFASLATYGRTLNFDLSRCEGYRNFCNKLWNATRFVLMNVEGKDCGLDPHEFRALSFVDRWLLGRLQQAEARHRREPRRSTASISRPARSTNSCGTSTATGTSSARRCSCSRPRRADDAAAARGTRSVLVRELEATLRLAHPFMPFITEELWQTVAPLAGKTGETISLQPFPKANFDHVDPSRGRATWRCCKDLVGACRALRSEMGLSPAQRVPLLVAGDPRCCSRTSRRICRRSPRSPRSNIVDELPVTDAPVAVVGETRLMLHIEVDVAAERERIGEGDRAPRGGDRQGSTRSSATRASWRAPRRTVVEQERARARRPPGDARPAEAPARAALGLTPPEPPSRAAPSRDPRARASRS